MREEIQPIRRSNPYKPKKTGWIRIKLLVRSQLHKFPRIESRAVQLWRHSRYLFLKTKWKLNAMWISQQGGCIRNIDVEKIYWISPTKIVFSSLREFNLHDFKGHILGGDWDRLEKRFDTLDIYVAIKQVCLGGKKWVDTAFYQNKLDKVKESHIHRDVNEEKYLGQRCQYIESLYNKIKNEGYKSQRELFLTGESQDPVVAEEEITVSVGRLGDFLFSDGAHRLTIAKLLGVPIIPIKVAVRHRDWIKLREELLRYTQDENVTKDGKLYQPITHPDLADIPASHNCEDRFTLINDTKSVRQGRLLDIGANLGYFCHRFEEQGFDCYAVENYPSTVYFLRKLARAENKKFRIITESVLESQEIKNTHFDIVLALNIFHHFLKTQENYDKLVDLLKNLQMNELFFEPHLHDEPQMQNAYRNYSPDEFVQFIIENSGLKHADLIGTMEDGRFLYKLN